MALCTPFRPLPSLQW